MVQCFLVLEDGKVMEGTGFGSRETVFGEVVFNTGMTGYQESLTDPSYRGQILVMSYPLMGNYGINDDYYQSEKVQVQGFVVRERCDEPTAMYEGRTLHHLLAADGIAGISDIDTRELIINIREHGTLKGAITFDDDLEKVLDEVRRMPHPCDRNLVGEASTKAIVTHPREGAMRIALIDCGVKGGILRDLKHRFDVTQVPFDTPAGYFMEERFDGVVVSNGPGDPSHPELKDTVVRTIREICQEQPMMGICMGNQLLSLAFGGSTYKMKFGHRGANQPVKFRERVFITSQNHGYAVDMDSLKDSGMVADQFNVNDGSVEGLRHEELPIFSVQYHPEASPGPWDTAFLFDDFRKALEASR